MTTKGFCVKCLNIRKSDIKVMLKKFLLKLLSKLQLFGEQRKFFENQLLQKNFSKNNFKKLIQKLIRNMVKKSEKAKIV